MIKEQYVTFETAKLAKEKGFNVWCEHSYTLDEHHFFVEVCSKNDSDGIFISAPTQSFLMKWLKEMHDIHIFNTFMGSLTIEKGMAYSADIVYKIKDDKIYTVKPIYIDKQKVYHEYIFDSYEDSIEEAIKQALNLLESEETK